MYKKSPPSEADCLLLALELLYVWRALYTCSETVLNRILSGKYFLCCAHHILWSSVRHVFGVTAGMLRVEMVLNLLESSGFGWQQTASA